MQCNMTSHLRPRPSPVNHSTTSTVYPHSTHQSIPVLSSNQYRPPSRFMLPDSTRTNMNRTYFTRKSSYRVPYLKTWSEYSESIPQSCTVDRLSIRRCRRPLTTWPFRTPQIIDRHFGKAIRNRIWKMPLWCYTRYLSYSALYETYLSVRKGHLVCWLR